MSGARIRTIYAGGGAASVAGYVGTGFHNWPPSHIPQDNGSETAASHRSPCQKDVRRGVRRRDRGQPPTATEDPDPKQLRRRDAATVAGYAGPGFHNWPSGHIDQTRDRKRHRSLCPNGATHTSPGQRPGNRIPENRCVLKEHRIGEVGGDVRGAENWRRPM
jgi:hypothetical protein